MFTGIIEDVGEVERIETAGEIERLSLLTHLNPSEIKLGDSIAVDGVCLTVVKKIGHLLQVDLSTETRQRTTLGFARPGQKVNLERALRAGDRFGGHLVQGHVDGMGTIIEREILGDQTVIHIQVPEEIARYIITKGSVAVDGISLTVNRVSGDVFSVTIIPHTARRTTIIQKGRGSKVNIESDIIGKYIEAILSRKRVIRKETEGGNLTVDFLREHGFA